jgi:hypothetical protein
MSATNTPQGPPPRWSDQAADWIGENVDKVAGAILVLTILVIAGVVFTLYNTPPVKVYVLATQTGEPVRVRPYGYGPVVELIPVEKTPRP